MRAVVGGPEARLERSCAPMEFMSIALLREYLELYGRRLNFERVGISVRGGGRFFRKSEKRGYFNPKRPSLLAVENPLNPGAGDVGAAPWRRSAAGRRRRGRGGAPGLRAALGRPRAPERPRLGRSCAPRAPATAPRRPPGGHPARRARARSQSGCYETGHEIEDPQHTIF